MKIVDAWMQHPSARFLQEPMFDSLRRWSGGKLAPAADCLKDLGNLAPGR